MRVLLTGSSGFIGTHTHVALLDAGHKVYCMDIAQDPAEDIVEYGAAMVKKVKPHAIIHLAAQPSLLRSWEAPEHDVTTNTLGTLRLALAAKEFHVERFIFASTSAVYARSQRSPYTEAMSRIDPDRPYGISKAAGEAYVRAFAPRPFVLRYGNVFGPRQIPIGDNQIVPRFLSYVFNGQKFAIYGDGEQSRDFIYVEDVAAANVACLHSQQSGTYNVSTGEGTKVRQVISTLMNATGYRGHVPHVAAKENDPQEVVLNPSRAHVFIPWRAKVSFEDGIKNTVEWWLENKCR